MLQILRNKAQSVVIQAIVVIIALVFIFWGVGTNMMNNRESAITINDEEISFEDFQKAYERTYANFKEQFGGNIPQNLLDSSLIKQQVINQLIQNALLRQGALQMGLTISPAEIQDAIESMVQFKENGSFSLDKYKSLLASSGYSPHKFEENIRYDILSQRVSLDIQGFAATTTEAEIADIYAIEKTQVAVNFLRISPQDFIEEITPTDEQLQSWFSGVKENYKTEPFLKLNYLPFTFSAIGKKITVDQESISEYYSKNISSFTQPEQRRARHILLKADNNASPEVHTDQLKKAETVLSMAQSGKDFAELAQKFSEGPTQANGGELGFFEKGRMVKTFDEAVFSMQSGDVSNIVKTDFGYHIIKLEEIKPSRISPLAEVEATISNQLQTKQAKPIAFQLANEAYEGIIGAGSLKKYLDQNPEVVLKKTDFFARTSPPSELQNHNKLLSTAFDLKEGEMSSLIETRDGYAILFAEKITPPTAPPLEKVKERVLVDYKNELASQMAQKKAEELLAKAKEVGSLETVAKETKRLMEFSDLLTKNSSKNSSSFPATLVEDAFRLTSKSPYPEAPGSVDNSMIVYEFAERKTPENAISESDKKVYQEALLQFKQQQILSSWMKGQEKVSTITTHKNI